MPTDYPGSLTGGTAQDFYGVIKDPRNLKPTYGNQFAQAGTGLSLALNTARLPAQGYGNLLDILMGQGRTDPAAFNRQVADIQRGTQGQQSAIQQQGAQAGLQGSGVMAALQAAAGQAGEDRVAGAYADENALAEERRRSDLLTLFQSLFVNPSIDLGLGGNQQDITNRNAQQDRELRRQTAAVNAFFQGLSGGIGAIGGGD